MNLNEPGPGPQPGPARRPPTPPPVLSFNSSQYLNEPNLTAVIAEPSYIAVTGSLLLEISRRVTCLITRLVARENYASASTAAAASALEQRLCLSVVRGLCARLHLRAGAACAL